MAGVDAGYAPRLSYELEGIRTRGEFLRAAAECVGALLPADQLYWTAVDTGEGAAEMYGTGGMGRPEIVQALGRWVGAHPLLLSYRDRPGDMAPLRLSDMIAVRAWRSHPVYAEVYRPLGAVHQICAAIIPYRDDRGAGWGFNRAGRDFTDDELELLARLQPVLIALNHGEHPGLRRVGVRAGDCGSEPGRSGGEGGPDAAGGPRPGTAGGRAHGDRDRARVPDQPANRP